MGVKKEILLTAACDECGRTLEKKTPTGGKRDFIEYARLNGWMMSERIDRAICPECRDKMREGRCNDRAKAWRKDEK